MSFNNLPTDRVDKAAEPEHGRLPCDSSEYGEYSWCVSFQPVFLRLFCNMPFVYLITEQCVSICIQD